MSTEPGILIDIKLSFQINHVSVCKAMMFDFVLEVMPVNSAVQTALSNDIMAEYPELWSGVRFCIMYHPTLIEYNLNSNRYVSEVLQP